MSIPEFHHERGDSLRDTGTGEVYRVERRLIDKDTGVMLYALRKDSNDREILRHKHLVDNWNCFQVSKPL